MSITYETKLISTKNEYELEYKGKKFSVITIHNPSEKKGQQWFYSLNGERIEAGSQKNFSTGEKIDNEIECFRLIDQALMNLEL